MLRVQVAGRRRDFGLGSLDLVTLEEARDKAREGRKIAKSGLDPSLERKRAMRLIPTFKEAAERYHQAVKASWRNGKHAGQWLSTLEAHAFPLIGATRVDHIDAPAIQSVLLPIWLTLPETARRVRQRVGSVLDYAYGQGWRGTDTPRNAVNSLMKRIKQPRRGPGFAAIPYADLPALMADLRGGQPSVGRYGLQFLILVRWLEKAVQSSHAAGGVGPYRIRLGADGLHAVHWSLNRPSPGPNLFFCLRHGVETEATLEDETPDLILAAVSAFMRELAESFGVTPLTPQSVATLAEKT